MSIWKQRVFPGCVLPCKQENGRFDRTMLHCKIILYEIKKIKSENDHSVERGFPNSSYFHH